jgi:CubicO group peptidase (beta-lactamase class C family)
LALRGGEEIKDEPTVDGINIRGRFQHIRGGGAAGAVQSTVPDMAKYAAALLRGGAGIVKPATFAQMTADQWRPDPRMEGWGLSFQLSRPFGRRVFGHGGGVLGGWNSLLTILPDEDLALVAHANISFQDFGKFTSRVLAAVLDEIPHALGGQVDEAVIAAAPGVYEAIPGLLTNFRVMGGVGRLQIKAADGGLMLHSRRGPWKKGVRLFPGDVGDPAFLVADDDPLDPSRIALIRDPDGQVTGLRCERLVQMVKTADVAPWA